MAEETKQAVVQTEQKQEEKVEVVKPVPEKTQPIVKKDAKKDEVKIVSEKEYTIPLRFGWMKSPRYKRTRKAVQLIKIYIAKHMKVQDRDLSKVKLDVYLNNDIWFKGCKTPPGKITVKATKDSTGIVKVDFVEIPEFVKFLKVKHAKMQTLTTTKPHVAKEQIEKPEQTKEEKKEEKEKEQSVAIAKEAQAEQRAKEEKHTIKTKQKLIPKQRTALSRH